MRPSWRLWLQSAGTQIDEKQVQAAIAGDLAKYKQPKRVFVTSDIPRNTMGKIQKKDLRDREWEGRDRRVG